VISLLLCTFKTIIMMAMIDITVHVYYCLKMQSVKLMGILGYIIIKREARQKTVFQPGKSASL